MAWHKNARWLWLTGVLVIAAIGSQIFLYRDRPETPAPEPVGTVESPQPEVLASKEPKVGNKTDVRRTVRSFMQARLQGSGAVRFVAPDSRDEFGRGGGLAPFYPKPPLRDFEIVFVDGPLGGPGYEVGVELIFARGRYGDTLFVLFQDGRYVINGGRPGLTGP